MQNTQGQGCSNSRLRLSSISWLLSQHPQTMERCTLCIVLLSGLCHITFTLPQYKFHFVNTPKPFHQARQYCRQMYADLVTVNDELDLAELDGLVDVSIPDGTYTGLVRPWGWSRSDTDDYQEGEAAYWNWEDGHPNGEWPCGSIGPSGKWNSTDCETKLSFFCYTGFMDVSQRFALVEEPMSWWEAQAHCRINYTDLARVRSLQENQQLQSMLNGNTYVNGSQVWMGVGRVNWRWSDSRHTSFVPWQPSQPEDTNLHCAKLETSANPAGFKLSDCGTQRPFFCYSVPVKRRWMRVAMKAGDSSLAITDPAVLKSLAGVVKKELKVSGYSADTKLAWEQPVKKNPVSQLFEPTSGPETFEGCF